MPVLLGRDCGHRAVKDSVQMIRIAAARKPDIIVHSWIEQGMWYVLADPRSETIMESERVTIACHPDDERAVRDLIALAQEQTT